MKNFAIAVPNSACFSSGNEPFGRNHRAKAAVLIDHISPLYQRRVQRVLQDSED